MTELWLIYKDAMDDEKRVAVDKPRFSVGRHSENDLCISDNRLSRQHLLIERDENDFLVSDRGSSNGTELNGEKLTDPKTLSAGDRLCLGGLDLEIELVAPEPEPDNAEPAAEPPPPPAPQAPAPSPRVEAEDAGFPKVFFIIAPVFVVLILSIVGIVIYLSGGRSTPSDNNNFIYSTDPDATPKNRKDKNTNSVSGSNIPTDLPPASPLPGNLGTNSDPVDNTNLTDTGKTEQNAAAFLRRAAQNDPKAFITGQQAKTVEIQIRSMAGNSAIAENLNSAKRSAAQIKTLATSKNIKPQFLAIAALTKLGSSKGDVLQTAQSMADILGKLGTQIGSELGDDCLLLMSAYDQGASGDFMKMRNMLQDLASKTPESSRSIRTIWFLHQNGKISESQFNFAVRFLAIGAISQNPKDYSVNSEALAL